VPGVVHGASSYIIQSKTGQLTPTHSISAGTSPRPTKAVPD
jgi:tryptophan synthase